MTDKLVEQVARAIATKGFGRPWDDFEELNAFDTDQNDLREYAEAAIEALASSSVPEQGKETALALDTLCNIHNYAFDKELPADTIIGAIRLVVSSALGELTPPPPAPQDRGASQEDGR